MQILTSSLNNIQQRPSDTVQKAARVSFKSMKCRLQPWEIGCYGVYLKMLIAFRFRMNENCKCSPRRIIHLLSGCNARTIPCWQGTQNTEATAAGRGGWIERLSNLPKPFAWPSRSGTSLTCHISLGDDSYINSLEWVSDFVLLRYTHSSQRCAEIYTACIPSGPLKISKEKPSAVRDVKASIHLC